MSSTTTSPRRPCDLMIRPTCSNTLRPRLSVDDVDRNLAAVAGGRGSHDGADGLGDAATPADHFAHVVRGDVEGKPQASSGRLDFDDHTLGLVNDLSGDILKHRLRGPTRRPVELVVAFVAHDTAVDAVPGEAHCRRLTWTRPEPPCIHRAHRT